MLKLKQFSRQDIFRYACLVCALPPIMLYISYFGFTSNIASSAFSKAEYDAIFHNGIFQYRVLGTFLVEIVYEVIVYFDLPSRTPAYLSIVHPNTTQEMFSAYFYTNVMTLFFATNALYFLIGNILFREQKMVADLAYLFILSLIIFSQFVIVPYDMLSYFFLFFAMYVILFCKNSIRSMLLLCMIVILGAMTHETAALMLSFFAAIHFDRLLKPVPVESGQLSERVRLIAMIASFLSVYTILRLIFGSDGETFFRHFRVQHNVRDLLSIVGFFFFVTLSLLLCSYDAARRTAMLFLFWASPFILAICLIGNPREIRSWVPVLISLIIIQLVGHFRPALFDTGLRSATT